MEKVLAAQPGIKISVPFLPLKRLGSLFVLLLALLGLLGLAAC